MAVLLLGWPGWHDLVSCIACWTCWCFVLLLLQNLLLKQAELPSSSNMLKAAVKTSLGAQALLLTLPSKKENITYSSFLNQYESIESWRQILQAFPLWVISVVPFRPSFARAFCLASRTSKSWKIRSVHMQAPFLYQFFFAKFCDRSADTFSKVSEGI